MQARIAICLAAAALLALSACTLRPELSPGSAGNGGGGNAGGGAGLPSAIALVHDGADIRAGTLLTFKWADAGAANFVRLDLFRNDGYESLFLDYAPNAGSYAWSIPAALQLADADTFSVKLTVYDQAVNPTILAQVRSPVFQIKQAAANPNGLSDVVVNAGAITVTMTDNGALVDGDIVQVSLNGSVVQSSLTLTGAGTQLPLTLRAGANTLAITALNEGTSPPNTACLDIGAVVSGQASQQWRLTAGQTGTVTIYYQP